MNTFSVKNLIIATLLILVTHFNVAFTQNIDHWETVVYAGDMWRYFAGVAEPDSGWQSFNFNDSTWSRGPGGIGYGDDDDETIIGPTVSLYMRINFSIADTGIIAMAIFNIDYDDAFVAYLNGTEIARAHIGVAGDHPAYDQTADELHEAVMYSNGTPEYYSLTEQQLSELLKPGQNILALQVHNANITSSDLSAIPFFSVAIKDDSFTYGVTPFWFNVPLDFIATNLPLIIIDTENQEVVYESKIMARMAIIDNNNAQGNKKTDPPNDYNGFIGVELHGQSSLGFEKKSYGIETRDSLGENLNVSLLGLPVENDWILYGPYSDKTLMRNALVYTLSGQLGHYAPRTRFCELIINNAYRGVYVLTEKIKRDNDRIDISSMLPADLAEPEISGGYIFKKDKTNPGDNIIRLNRGLELIITEPKKDVIQPGQTQWLSDYLNSFENVLYGNGDYEDFIDVLSFADNFLLVELAKNIDGYRLSTYFYKDRNGKIIAAPVWDYNLSLGNADYLEGWTAKGWYYPLISGWDQNWWLKLLDDAAFQDICKTRWTELRSSQFSEDNIFSLIDEWVSHLADAQLRNFNLYPILGIYIWPNPGFPQSDGNAPKSNGPTTWQEEISALKNFIHERLLWMDQNMPGEITSVNVENNAAVQQDIQQPPFPNPFNATCVITFKIETPGLLSINIFDILGRTVRTETFSASIAGPYTFVWDGYGNMRNQLSSGMYFFTINSGRNLIYKGKFVKVD